MNLQLMSVCGCSISLSYVDGIANVTLSSTDTSVIRVYPDVSPGAVANIIDIVAIVARSVQYDDKTGDAHLAFEVCDYFESELGLECSFEFVDRSYQHIRARFTLMSHDMDALDYCHVGVTLDLSLTQLLLESEFANRTTPFPGSA